MEKQIDKKHKKITRKTLVAELAISFLIVCLLFFLLMIILVDR